MKIMYKIKFSFGDAEEFWGDEDYVGEGNDPSDTRLYSSEIILTEKQWNDAVDDGYIPTNGIIDIVVDNNPDIVDSLLTGGDCSIGDDDGFNGSGVTFTVSLEKI